MRQLGICQLLRDQQNLDIQQKQITHRWLIEPPTMESSGHLAGPCPLLTREQLFSW